MRRLTYSQSHMWCRGLERSGAVVAFGGLYFAPSLLLWAKIPTRLCAMSNGLCEVLFSFTSENHQ